MIIHKALIINEGGPSFPRLAFCTSFYINYVFLPLLIYLFVFLVKLHELLKDNNCVSHILLQIFLPACCQAFNSASIIFKVKAFKHFMQSNLQLSQDPSTCFCSPHRRSTPSTHLLLKDTSPAKAPLPFLPYECSSLYRIISSIYKQVITIMNNNNPCLDSIMASGQCPSLQQNPLQSCPPPHSVYFLSSCLNPASQGFCPHPVLGATLINTVASTWSHPMVCPQASWLMSLTQLTSHSLLFETCFFAWLLGLHTPLSNLTCFMDV